MKRAFVTVERAGVFICISAAVLLGSFMLKRSLFTKAGTARSVGIHLNEPVPLQIIDWSTSPLTLLLVMDNSCRFCSASASFYQRLLRETSNGKGLRAVAVLPQPNPESFEYLKQIGLDVKDVAQATPKSLGLPGTPSMLLVDKTGIIRGMWVGQLTPREEAGVMDISCPLLQPVIVQRHASRPNARAVGQRLSIIS